MACARAASSPDAQRQSAGVHRLGPCSAEPANQVIQVKGLKYSYDEDGVLVSESTYVDGVIKDRREYVKKQ